MIDFCMIELLIIVRNGWRKPGLQGSTEISSHGQANRQTDIAYNLYKLISKNAASEGERGLEFSEIK